MKKLIKVGVLLAAAVGARAADMQTAHQNETMTKDSQGMESMPMKMDSDRDFVTGMKAHHQQALEMAQMELKEGKDSKAKAFASKIIVSQKKEIEQFERWLSDHPEKPEP